MLNVSHLTKLVELLLGNELVVVVGGGGPALFELLGQGVEEGGPTGRRAQARDVKYLASGFLSVTSDLCILLCPSVQWPIHSHTIYSHTNIVRS